VLLRRNKGKNKRNTSGFRGVHRSKKKNLKKVWIATIQSAGKKHNLGLYSSPEEAALAWDHAAIRLHGEFAVLNFPDAQKYEHPAQGCNHPRLERGNQDSG
jgi:hypothetical protein